MAEPLVTIVGFRVDEHSLSCSPAAVLKPVVRQRSMLSELLAQALTDSPRSTSNQSFNDHTSTEDEWSGESSDDEQDDHAAAELTVSEDDEELNVTRPIDIPVPKDKLKKAAFYRNMRLKLELRRNDHMRQRVPSRLHYV